MADLVSAGRRAARRPHEGRLGKDARHQAREAALQMLYQWEVGRHRRSPARPRRSSGCSGPARRPPPDDLRQFATALAQETVDQLQTIDPLIAETTERWRPERMAVLDRLILRMAVTELLRRDATPAAVVINEALEIARTFQHRRCGEVHQRHAGWRAEEAGGMNGSLRRRHPSAFLCPAVEQLAQFYVIPRRTD